MRKNTFGTLFKELRIAQGMTLRRFCEAHGYDPGNISKLERGLRLPPDSEEDLKEYAKALRIREGSDTWHQFFDLARIERGKLPPGVLRDEKLMGRLPILFRTLRGQKLSAEKLDELIEMIRRS